MSHAHSNRTTRTVWSALLTVTALLALSLNPPARAQCQGDLNSDGQVNAQDLAILLGGWGICGPVISSVTPAQGTVLGGTVISITGTGLATTTSVRIGGVACTNLNVLTPTLVRATTPPGAAGEVSISVTTAGGTILAPQFFTYVQQSVASIVPNTGSYSGGTSISITG